MVHDQHPRTVPVGPAALWHWMSEREHIRIRRSLGHAKPWTVDPILQQYRFCNVFREEDAVTKWVHAHIRVPFADHPNLWFMLCIARWINRPETLAELIQHPSWPTGTARGWTPKQQAAMALVLDEMIGAKRVAYTGAYMIRAESNPNVEWYPWSKQRYVTEIVLGRVWAARATLYHILAHPREVTRQAIPSARLQDVHAWFAAQYGWGGFMSYEVVTDLRHTRYLRGAPDIMLWANAGPGALRGLNRVAGRAPRAPLTQEQANEEMKALLALAQERFGLRLHDHQLEMRDIEHSLCEVDKYLRVALNEGRPRARYPGRR